MSGFQGDLQFGEKYEELFMKTIQWKEHKIVKDKFKPYDCWIINDDDEQVFFEVKADRLAMKTGNIAIEFECNGLPSGISSTEADYWVHFIHGKKEYYLIPADELRQRIAKKTYLCEVKGGDGWRSKMFLFPGSAFDEFRIDYADQNISDI